MVYLISKIDGHSVAVVNTQVKRGDEWKIRFNLKGRKFFEYIVSSDPILIIPSYTEFDPYSMSSEDEDGIWERVSFGSLSHGKAKFKVTAKRDILLGDGLWDRVAVMATVNGGSSCYVMSFSSGLLKLGESVFVEGETLNKSIYDYLSDEDDFISDLDQSVKVVNCSSSYDNFISCSDYKIEAEPHQQGCYVIDGMISDSDLANLKDSKNV